MRQVFKSYDGIFIFGKYKGKPLSEVPSSYIVWCAENEVCEFPDNILDAAERDDRESSWLQESDVWDND